MSTARYLFALCVGVLVCVVAGAGGYLLVVQPFLERGSTLGWVGAMLALAFAIHAAIESVFPRSAYVFPDPIPFRRVGEGGFVCSRSGCCSASPVRAKYHAFLASPAPEQPTHTVYRFRTVLPPVAARKRSGEDERPVLLILLLAAGAAVLAAGAVVAWAHS